MAYSHHAPWLHLFVVFFVAALVLSSSASKEDQRPLPHIVFLLVDDWGWADASWHRPRGYQEIQTPNIQALLEDGVELDRNYVYKFCSPTRSAIQSGRNPIHVNAQNVGMMTWDPKNPFTGVSGIPVNMTGFAQRLAEAGYKHRVFSGKADFGMAFQKQTPMGRGYTDALFYFAHMNDYWSLDLGTHGIDDGSCNDSKGVVKMHDLFGTNPDGTSGPQRKLLNPQHCWVQSNIFNGSGPPFPENIEGCVYEEDYFTNFTVRHIMEHRPEDGPLLAFHATHSIHSPMQVVPDAYERFKFIDWEARRRYNAMVWNIDRAVGLIIGALKTKGLYDNSLIVVSSDNGGPIYRKGAAGANNFPLRGGKAGNWEGGVRVNGLVAGGYLPASMRGKKLEGLVAAWDWYATFVHGIAGLDAADAEAAAAGLPSIDSIDLWPYLSGANPTPPRRSVAFGTTQDPTDLWAERNDIVVGALVQQDPTDSRRLWKLVVGREPQSIWMGPEFPNATTFAQPATETVFGDCGFAPGCLFDVTADPEEHHNVAADNPEVALRLLAAIKAANATVFAPLRPSYQAEACKIALSLYGMAGHRHGWWGPFAETHQALDPRVNAVV